MAARRPHIAPSDSFVGRGGQRAAVRPARGARAQLSDGRSADGDGTTKIAHSLHLAWSLHVSLLARSWPASTRKIEQAGKTQLLFLQEAQATAAAEPPPAAACRTICAPRLQHREAWSRRRTYGSSRRGPVRWQASVRP